MRVAVKAALGVAVRALLFRQVPDDERLVARSREEHVGVLERGGQGGDPARVALKGAAKNELLGHDELTARAC